MTRHVPIKLAKTLLHHLNDDGVTPAVVRFLDTYFDCYVNHLVILKQIFMSEQIDNDRVGRDAWATGQLESKHWLLSTVAGLNLKLGETWIVCGWIGSLALLMDNFKTSISFDRIRSFDIDQRCASLADSLNKRMVLNDWKFKASTMDAYDIYYTDFMWQTEKYNGSTDRVIGTADTIINTSCEHLEDFDTWFDNIPFGKLVVLQCSDHESYDGHVNSMSNMYELSYRAKCRRLLYKGTLDCGEYSRHMLIGVK